MVSGVVAPPTCGLRDSQCALAMTIARGFGNRAASSVSRWPVSPGCSAVIGEPCEM